MIGGIGRAGVVFHLHVALKVQLTSINSLDRTAVESGNRVAGDGKRGIRDSVTVNNSA